MHHGPAEACPREAVTQVRRGVRCHVTLHAPFSIFIRGGKYPLKGLPVGTSGKGGRWRWWRARGWNLLVYGTSRWMLVLLFYFIFISRILPSVLELCCCLLHECLSSLPDLVFLLISLWLAPSLVSFRSRRSKSLSLSRLVHLLQYHLSQFWLPRHSSSLVCVSSLGSSRPVDLLYSSSLTPFMSSAVHVSITFCPAPFRFHVISSSRLL